MFETRAWVLHQGGDDDRPADLTEETYHVADLEPREVLVEPIFGCWEANMAHAIRRRPIDICRNRRERRVVIGNAGVVRVLAAGADASDLHEGQACLLFCNGTWDAQGFPERIFAYDAPGTTGVLARRTKVHRQQLIPLPVRSRFSLQQWAAFSLRYITAWANWKVALGCWRLTGGAREGVAADVWGWGGGVAFAELTLAQLLGHRATMMASTDDRLAGLAAAGLTAVDRRGFGAMQFDPARYDIDAAYRQEYLAGEETFLRVVDGRTGGAGVSIFVDFIGLPVYRATLKALSRGGVITTAGWKAGMHLTTVRAIECMQWHTHVHTHYARYADGVEAVAFAEARGWLPEVGPVYGWQEIPALAADYAAGRLATYFPLFSINAA